MSTLNIFRHDVAAQPVQRIRLNFDNLGIACVIASDIFDLNCSRICFRIFSDAENRITRFQNIGVCIPVIGIAFSVKF